MLTLLICIAIISLLSAIVLVYGLFKRTVLVGLAVVLNMFVVLLSLVALSPAFATTGPHLKSRASAPTVPRTPAPSCTQLQPESAAN